MMIYLGQPAADPGHARTVRQIRYSRLKSFCTYHTSMIATKYAAGHQPAAAAAFGKW